MPKRISKADELDRIMKASEIEANNPDMPMKHILLQAGYPPTTAERGTAALSWWRSPFHNSLVAMYRRATDIKEVTEAYYVVMLRPLFNLGIKELVDRFSDEDEIKKIPLEKLANIVFKAAELNVKVVEQLPEKARENIRHIVQQSQLYADENIEPIEDCLGNGANNELPN